MPNEPVYLKPNALVEPLFNQWYAWSHLIAPANAALYTANVHLKILQSFIAAPQIHAAAYRNPEMIGGPFVNYDASRVREVEELLQSTIKERSDLLAFARAFQNFDRALIEKSDGHSLESRYAEAPDELKGYVELVYDLNNQPAVRFIEALLYRSRYYNPAAQSVALSLLDSDERQFVLSTPRLEDESHMQLRIPFSDERLDELFSMRRGPRPYGFIKELLGLSDGEDKLFASFFTPAGSATGARYADEKVRIRYYGHACLLIETKDTSILTDPVISYRMDGGIRRYTYDDLPASLDYALITHNHQDHCMFEVLLQLRHKIKKLIVPRSNSGVLSDPSLKLTLQTIGFRNVQELDELETMEIEGGSITGIPFLGEHGDLNVRTKLAYLVALQGRQVLAVADSNNLEPRLYDHIHNLYGNVDALFVGMECDGAPLSWAYGGLLNRPLARKADQSRRLNGSNYEKARDLVSRLNPHQVYVYAMGQEPWLTHVVAIKYTDQSPPIIESNKLLAWCRDRGLKAERLFGCKEIFL